MWTCKLRRRTLSPCVRLTLAQAPSPGFSLIMAAFAVVYVYQCFGGALEGLCGVQNDVRLCQ